MYSNERYQIFFFFFKTKVTGCKPNEIVQVNINYSTWTK